jgi:hypothetical protein
MTDFSTISSEDLDKKKLGNFYAEATPKKQ